MKKLFILLLAVCLVLVGCGAAPAAEVSCGHEAYQVLIDALEQKDYDAARAIIDAMEGKAEPIETAAHETAAPETVAPAVQAAVEELETVELTRQNLLDYFELKEEYIFEDTVQCYQHFLLREEYKKRLVDIRDVTVEISCFDATAYGELDRGDQLFFPGSYEMTTGELEHKSVAITNLGEGFIALSEYDAKGGCFSGYQMDIAITDVSGTLVLSEQ